jgi:hypothetical protein
MSLCILVSWLFLRYSPFLILKRLLEQAQPSMDKKLKVGVAPKGSGEWLILLSVVLALGDSCIELLSG